MGFIIIIAIVIIFIYFKFVRGRKKLTIGTVNIITGAPKTGKSALCCYLSDITEKKKHRKVIWFNFFHKKEKRQEIPLYYSTIPVRRDYSPVTDDIVMRKKRMRYNSVMNVDEAYLFADSQQFTDQDVNTQLSLFTKLIGHETRSSDVLFINTQSIEDCHYAIKRCAPTYLMILEKPKWFFWFWARIKVREVYNTGVVPVTNVSSEDVGSDPAVKTIFMPTRYFKFYDCYAFSKLTDDLDVSDDIVHGKKLSNLKTNDIVSVKDIIERNKKNKIVVKGGDKNVRKSTRKSTASKK